MDCLDLVSSGLSRYVVAEIGGLMTPALAIYADVVDANIAATVRLTGSAERWRPHIKTAKLGFTIRRLIEHGITNLKCATTLELLTACEAGAKDVCVAYPMIGSAAVRVRQIAEQFPAVAVSALVENGAQVQAWRESRVGLFLDLNPGMDRTGIDPRRRDDIVALARAVRNAGLRFRGLHWYEGHHHEPLAERMTAAHRGYDKLMRVVSALRRSGIGVEEVITSGTPALPCALAYEGFRTDEFVHRVSPGTVVYNDATSLEQLPREYGLQPAALVIATVVSRPAERLITCDAGHKTVSADAGVPSCSVLRFPKLKPLRPSEEHLPIEVPAGAAAPRIGERLYLLPRHVCPTVNNFDDALIVRGGRITAVEPVTARGRETPLQGSFADIADGARTLS